MLNHADEPNAEFFASVDHVVIKATRAIPVGAEITIDYGWGEFEWASVGGAPAGSAAGAKKAKGKIAAKR
jgi:hypothetical protein